MIFSMFFLAVGGRSQSSTSSPRASPNLTTTSSTPHRSPRASPISPMLHSHWMNSAGPIHHDGADLDGPLNLTKPKTDPRDAKLASALQQHQQQQQQQSVYPPVTSATHMPAIVKSEPPQLIAPPPAHSNHARSTLTPYPPTDMPLLKSPFNAAQHYVSNPYSGIPTHSRGELTLGPLGSLSPHLTSPPQAKSSPSPTMTEKVCGFYPPTTAALAEQYILVHIT